MSVSTSTSARISTRLIWSIVSYNAIERLKCQVHLDLVYLVRTVSQSAFGTLCNNILEGALEKHLRVVADIGINTEWHGKVFECLDTTYIPIFTSGSLTSPPAMLHRLFHLFLWHSEPLVFYAPAQGIRISVGRRMIGHLRLWSQKHIKCAQPANRT